MILRGSIVCSQQTSLKAQQTTRASLCLQSHLDCLGQNKSATNQHASQECLLVSLSLYLSRLNISLNARTRYKSNGSSGQSMSYMSSIFLTWKPMLERWAMIALKSPLYWSKKGKRYLHTGSLKSISTAFSRLFCPETFWSFFTSRPPMQSWSSSP